MTNKQVLRTFLRRRMVERYAGLGSMDDPTGKIVKALLDDEEMMASIEKEIPLEVMEQIGGTRQAALSVSHALEKAKSLADGNILTQDGYQDILNQVDVRDRYPFTIALVEHEIKVADHKSAQSVSPGTVWMRERDRTIAEVVMVNSDGSIYAESPIGGLAYDSAREWAQDFKPIAEAEDLDREGAVDLLTRDESNDRSTYSHYSDFPAGEISSEPAGTSELDYPGTRRVEGMDQTAGFEDLASPQEQFMMQDLVGKGNVDQAWELLKDVSERSKIKDGESGNSLTDLTTEKWGKVAQANEEVEKTGKYNPDAFLTLDQIDAGEGPCQKNRK